METEKQKIISDEDQARLIKLLSALVQTAADHGFAASNELIVDGTHQPEIHEEKTKDNSPTKPTSALIKLRVLL